MKFPTLIETKKNSFNTSLLKKTKIKPSRLFSNLPLLLMCLPAVLLLFIFRYLPMSGVVMAFKRFDVVKGFFGSDWVGLENFSFFFRSMDAWVILRNTIGFNLVFMLTGTIGAIVVALLLYEIKSRFALKVYQTVLFFPYFLSWVVVSYLAYTFLSVDYGILNQIFETFGLERVDWYHEPDFWPVLLVLISLWKGIGYGSIVYYTSLVGIDPEYFDAAAIDGASKLQTMWHISLPFLKPMISILSILGVGSIMYADFGLFFTVPRDSGALYTVTDVMDTYVYRALRVTGEIGISSAVNFFQAIVGFVLVVVTNITVKKFNEDLTLF